MNLSPETSKGGGGTHKSEKHFFSIFFLFRKGFVEMLLWQARHTGDRRFALTLPRCRGKLDWKCFRFRFRFRCECVCVCVCVFFLLACNTETRDAWYYSKRHQATEVHPFFALQMSPLDRGTPPKTALS